MSLTPRADWLAVTVLASGLAISAGARADTVQSVVAVVNDQAISKYDVEQRMRLVLSSSGVKPTPDTIKRIQPQVLRALVDEHLELQEAEKHKIVISDDQVDQTLAAISKQNSMGSGGIEAFMAKSNIDIATLRAQIRAELAWQQLVGERYGSRVYVSDSDVNAEYKRYADSMKHPQFLVSEIYLPVENPDQAADVERTANGLVGDLKHGAPFTTLARQFSKSPSAAEGGDLGWIQTGQLEPAVGKKVAAMSMGQISEPIRTAGGYSIIFLRNRREAGTTGEGKLKSAHLKQIAFPFPPKASASQVQEVESKAAHISRNIAGCASVDQFKNQPGVIVSDFGMLAAGQISPFIRQAVSHIEPGDPSPPLRGREGVVILVVCSKKTGPAPKATMPTKEEIENRLVSQQLSMQGRRYIRDLRRDAVIDYRIPEMKQAF